MCHSKTYSFNEVILCSAPPSLLLNNAECYMSIKTLTPSTHRRKCCTGEASVSCVHLCCMLTRRKQCFTLFLCTLHILYFVSPRSCYSRLALCVCVRVWVHVWVCVRARVLSSDPRVAPSPASSFSTP